VPVVDAHHALDDALVTAQLFLVLATKRGGDGAARVADLLRASATRGGH
jgi:DNA polymerase III epsilon subunit-like protein